jgi:predicted dehydrogenase
MRHRIAVIGAGMAFEPHAKSLADGRASRGRCGRHPRPRPPAATRARYAFPVSGDLDAVVADRSIDTALVLTPPHAHLPVIRALAAAGKHVLVEKPLAPTAADARAAVRACAEAGVTLAVVLQHRFRPAALALAEAIAAGELGAIATAAVSIRWWRPQSYYDEPGRGTLARDGGGVLVTQAIHTLDLFLALAPPVREVTAFSGTSAVHRMETEDSAAGGALRQRRARQHRRDDRRLPRLHRADRVFRHAGDRGARRQPAGAAGTGRQPADRRRGGRHRRWRRPDGVRHDHHRAVLAGSRR